MQHPVERVSKVMWHASHPNEVRQRYGVNDKGWAECSYQLRKERKKRVVVGDDLARLLQHTGCQVRALLFQVMVVLINR